MKMQRNAASGKLQVDEKKKARQAVARDRHRRTKKELGNRAFRGSLVWPGPGLVQVKGGEPVGTLSVQGPRQLNRTVKWVGVSGSTAGGSLELAALCLVLGVGVCGCCRHCAHPVRS